MALYRFPKRESATTGVCNTFHLLKTKNYFQLLKCALVDRRQPRREKGDEAMHLTLSKTQTLGPPATFIVRFGPLTLTKPEIEWSRRYGSEILETFLAQHGGIAAVQANAGTSMSFVSAAAAEDFVTDLHDACGQTRAYWLVADAFSGNDDYDSTV